MEHPIGSLMDTTMEKIKEMIDVNTIIGEPITSPDGTLIIPVSKVSYGFAAGGSDLPTKKENKDCFGGGRAVPCFLCQKRRCNACVRHSE